MWQKFQTTHRRASAIPPRLLLTAAHRRSFFRRSRLFFREAAFFSGGEGCEWGAKQPTVGESGDKTENEFSGFIPLAVPRKGFSPHIPASRLFVLFHPTQPHQIKQLLSKIAVNERAVVPGFNFTGFFAAIKRKIVTLWYGYTLHISAYHSAHLYAPVGILCRHGNRLCVGE